MEYKLIKKFLPELYISKYYNSEDVVYAEHLEAELAKGVEVFGNDQEINNADFTTEKYDSDTHLGLLIGYKPIESSKPVSREEIERALSESAPEYQLEDLLKRILENGVK